MLVGVVDIASANMNDLALSNLPRACASNIRASLRKEVYGLAKQQPIIAWKLVETFLCADKKMANRVFEKSRSESITFKFAAPTGVEEGPVEDVNHEFQQLLPAGRAWEPSVRKEEEDLVIYYSVNDTCWNFFGLRFVDKRWQLVMLGGGCD
jgi:hypothetical protein